MSGSALLTQTELPVKNRGFVCVFYNGGGFLLGSDGLLTPWFPGSVCCFIGGTQTPAERRQVQSAFWFVLSTVPKVFYHLSYHLSTFSLQLFCSTDSSSSSPQMCCTTSPGKVGKLFHMNSKNLLKDPHGKCIFPRLSFTLCTAKIKRTSIFIN